MKKKNQITQVTVDNITFKVGDKVVLSIKEKGDKTCIISHFFEDDGWVAALGHNPYCFTEEDVREGTVRKVG